MLHRLRPFFGNNGGMYLWNVASRSFSGPICSIPQLIKLCFEFPLIPLFHHPCSCRLKFIQLWTQTLVLFNNFLIISGGANAPIFLSRKVERGRETSPSTYEIVTARVMGSYDQSDLHINRNDKTRVSTNFKFPSGLGSDVPMARFWR